MPLILDTYNVIHAGISMGGGMGDLTVRKLCQWISSSSGRQKTTLVMDGRAKPDEPSANEFPDIHLVYSGAGVSADLVIGQMVERSANRRNVTVVSNDRAVQAAARRVGAKPQSCETFLGLLMSGRFAAKARAKGAMPAGKTQGSPSEGETEHWMKEFGIDPKGVAKKEKKAGEGEIDMKKLMGF